MLKRAPSPALFVLLSALLSIRLAACGRALSQLGGPHDDLIEQADLYPYSELRSRQSQVVLLCVPYFERVEREDESIMVSLV